MSVTVETLFKGFTKSFGNLTSDPKEDRDQPYVLRKHGAIQRCLSKMVNAKETNTLHYAETWLAFRKEVINPETDYMRDPLLTLLRARLAELSLRHDHGIGEYYQERLEDDFSLAYSEATLSFRETTRVFRLLFGELTDPHLQWIYLQLVAFMQFVYVKFMNKGYRQLPEYFEEEKERAIRVWNDHKLGELWNYDKVHPFVTTLCPPSEILDKYQIDGKDCVVQEDGTVITFDRGTIDFVKVPPKVKWSPRSGMI